MTTEAVAPPEQEVGAVKPKRRYDIDWLRVLAVLLLFYAHPARIFLTSGPWYVQNIQKSELITIGALFIDQWQMALLFLLAGASTLFALRFRTGREYLIERFKRLLVPLVFGLLVIVPPQLYIEILGFGGGSYIDFYPKYFDGEFTGGFDMGHLWFIAYLFGYSLLALPLFLFLKRESGRRMLSKLGQFFSLPGMIFLFVLPIALADHLLYDFYPNPIYFFTFFMLGYLLLADDGFEEAIGKSKLIALIIGILSFAVWYTLISRRIRIPIWLGSLTRGVVSWCCLIAILGYGRQFLNFTNRFLKYQGAASYPVYILHQTIIIAIGYFVIRWRIGVFPKFIVIIAGSVLATFALYEVLVKRTNLTRFLFGMRPKRKE
jgi:peptidoglycan/LPS O-acetylase OafA/YrhL